jgi:hypothetical protein
MENKKEAPLVLVKTWISLARSKDAEPEVKERAQYMLRESVGTNEDVVRYMKKYGIK